MDVKSAFLNGPINELVYVKQSPAFEDPYFPDLVYQLDKAVYALKKPHVRGMTTLPSCYKIVDLK